MRYQFPSERLPQHRQRQPLASSARPQLPLDRTHPHAQIANRHYARSRIIRQGNQPLSSITVLLLLKDDRNLRSFISNIVIVGIGIGKFASVDGHLYSFT